MSWIFAPLPSLGDENKEPISDANDDAPVPFVEMILSRMEFTTGDSDILDEEILSRMEFTTGDSDILDEDKSDDIDLFIVSSPVEPLIVGMVLVVAVSIPSPCGTPVVAFVAMTVSEALVEGEGEGEGVGTEAVVVGGACPLGKIWTVV
jgi:hypothetical protein